MRNVFILALAALVLATGGWLWSGGSLVGLTDRTAPMVTCTRSSGDSRRMILSLTAHDTQTGVNSFRASVIQGSKEIELTSEQLSAPSAVTEKLVELDSRALGLLEGTATVRCDARDASWWHNHGSAEAQIKLDFTPPSISVLSRQFTANQGGAEFILYRVGGGEYTRTGVQIGDLFFRGFPGSAFDARLAGHPEIHGALIGLPLGFDPTREKIRVIVEDDGGNLAQSTIDFPVKPTKQVDMASKLSLSFLERKLPDLIISYEDRSRQRVDQSDMSPDSQIARFRLINETYRRALQQEMFALIDKSEPRRLWTGVFSRPIPGSTTSLFGERRNYGLDGKPAGGSLHEGLDLASVQNDVVKAVNAGIVAFAGEFGIYGNAVMIDHGTGLFSLYGHLSSTSVSAGATVQRDQEVGRTGATGLAGGDHLHFEFRVGHVSVNPIEWWDAKWIEDNIDGKVTEYLSAFGAQPAGVK